ncbi:colicin immunity domain-containing protein [Opitutus sp. ER46]|uniref:colicin immunity domain-containing protein n=1 Tax=Opitutus sp. ER46 TaxID=2161864 RepID=UPI001304CB4E|nr:colicin immunity domain-containing protein [Opitutus sp. ER46]
MKKIHKDCIKKYIELIGQYDSGDIDASAFEVLYIRKFKRESIDLPKDVFEELDRLFGDVDAYSPDDRDRVIGSIDEGALRMSAKRTLSALRLVCGIT